MLLISLWSSDFSPDSRTLEAGSPGVSGSPFETPRGSGIEASDVAHEENENFAHGDEAPAEQAQGAWSKQEGAD